MTYFEDNNISVNKICTNTNGSNTFWIDDKHQLYTCGKNAHSQLGIGDNKNRRKPELITNLKDIIDVTYGDKCSIALCKSVLNISVIDYLIRKHKIDNVPIDVILLIKSMYDINKIYDTKTADNYWREAEILKDRDISRIFSGGYHAFCLESDGTLWGMGDNRQSQLALDKDIYNIDNIEWTKISIIMDFKIRISDIACGCQHTLIIDINGKIYSFGSNQYDQCGQNNINTNLLIPTLIPALKRERIIKIKSASWHSYAMSDKKEHYLFGDNADNQCTLKYSTDRRVKIPFNINSVFDELTLGKYQIKEVFLGLDNTLIIAL